MCRARRARAQHVEQRHRVGVAHQVEADHPLALDPLEHACHVHVAIGIEHDLAAAEQRPERRPLAAGVHQRPEGELHELRGPRVAGRQEALQPQRGLLHHGRGDVLGAFDRRTPGIPAAENCKEDVLVAPHHALGHARGAAGVEDVVIVGGPLREVARRRCRRDQRLELVTRLDDDLRRLHLSVGARHRRRGPAGRRPRRDTSARRPRSAS